MGDGAQGVVSEVAAALGVEIALVQGEGGAFDIIDRSSARVWRIPYSAEELAEFARNREPSGIAAGVGAADGSGSVSPGAALLAIHISEAVATAVPGTNALRIERDGVRTE